MLLFYISSFMIVIFTIYFHYTFKIGNNVKTIDFIKLYKNLAKHLWKKKNTSEWILFIEMSHGFCIKTWNPWNHNETLNI